MDNENREVELEGIQVTESDYDAFDEEWGDGPAEEDDMDLSDEEPADESEPESTETEEQETDDTPSQEAEAETQEQADEPAKESGEQRNQRFTLKHLDETKDYSEEEMVALAQKGLDYDFIKQQRDELRAEKARYDKYEAFLKKLAEKSNLTVEQQMDHSEALMMVAEAEDRGETLTEAEALLRIQQERRDQSKAAEDAAKEPKAEKGADTKTPEEIRNEAFARFVELYPEVKAENIPQEVWNDFAKNGDLAVSYQRYENKQLRQEIEQLKQNQKNKERSTGSRRSAGATTPKDAFDEGWDSI